MSAINSTDRSKCSDRKDAVIQVSSLEGVGVELGPDAVEPIQDVEGPPLRRSLEQRVLNEMCQAVLSRQLIARARFDQQSAVPDVASVLEVYAPEPIGQRPSVEC